MLKNKSLWLVLIGLSVFIFIACESNSQKDKTTVIPENVISQELHQAHCDLLAKANIKLAEINQKVRELNDKIRKSDKKLSEAQNTTLDEIEEKQISINKRMHEIKNVKQEDWENFKTTFEKDLDEVKTKIDNILDTL
jgi:DNA anti-recombination protein RmuC